MHWVETNGGLALYLNGKLAGWVTSTLNGRFLHGVRNQQVSMKDSSSSRHEAKSKLLQSIGE